MTMRIVWDQYKDWIGQLIRISIRITDSTVIDKDGILYSIDPESYNVILLSREDDGSRYLAVHVTAKAVEKMIRLDDTFSVKLNDLEIKELKTISLSSDHIIRRKKHICNILKERRVDVSVDDASGRIEILGGQVLVEPPYDASNFSGENEIVLRRIRCLVTAESIADRS